MKKSRMKKPVQITLILICSLMLVPALSGEDLSEQSDTGLRGKIFGDQLILIDKTGRQLTPEDGIYTTEDGAKITVKGGTIVDLPASQGKRRILTFRIIEVDCFETE